MQSAAPIIPSQPSVAGLRTLHLGTPPQPQLVGASPVWRKLLSQAEMVAPHLHVASLEGEPGSGKQTIARFLHSRSFVSRSPFQRRDAREWFATDVQPGELQGFLYLDRVDLLDTSAQGSLLRILKMLQMQTIRRAVLVASSQASLRQMATQGQLIPDLAFRLTAMRFAIPPLRQRREDITPMAEFFLERLCRRYHQHPVTLSPAALVRLMQHSWPGNLPELASVLEASLLNAADGVIHAENLSIDDLPVASTCETRPVPRIAELSLDSVIRHHVQHVLNLNHGNKLRAARQLGISRSTLYRILSSGGLLEH